MPIYSIGRNGPGCCTDTAGRPAWVRVALLNGKVRAACPRNRQLPRMTQDGV